jgi:hypothetical protein
MMFHPCILLLPADCLCDSYALHYQVQAIPVWPSQEGTTLLISAPLQTCDYGYCLPTQIQQMLSIKDPQA